MRGLWRVYVHVCAFINSVGLVSGDCFLPFFRIGFPLVWFLMCVVSLGGCPIFQENDNQVFGAKYRFGGGCHQGLLLGTKFEWWCQHLWGTLKVELVPGGLVS